MDDLVTRLRVHLRRESTHAGSLLDTLCHLAEGLPGELYAVGGVVRDLLMGSHDRGPRRLDLDLAFDGESAPLQRALSETAGAPLTIHERFRTASVVLPDGASIDLARTRSEQYPSPGALPIVEPAPIEIDLRRRDFSVNSMALVLTGSRAGSLLDPHSGIADLQSGRIRTLHERSFRDDPTRLIRAARYAARIGGTIERRTMTDARRDRRHLQALSADRFGDAWRLLLQERQAGDAIELARRLRISEARDPHWRVPKAAAASWSNPEQFWAVNGLLSRDAAIAEWLPSSVGLKRQERAALEAGVRLQQTKRSVRQMRRPSRIARSLRQYPDCALEAALRVWTGASRRAVAEFLDRRRCVRSPWNADELMKLGIERGPELGRWIEQIESAIWDGDLDPSDAPSVARMEQRIRLSR